MKDILFTTNEYVFSYRVAGIVIHNNKILLQKPTNDSAYAIPGGHVAFGETNAESLMREFKEEIGADITVGDLKWVAENFFPWGGKPCHQICLYYDVALADNKQIPLTDMFIGKEQLMNQNFSMEFHWLPIDNLHNIELYPPNIIKRLEQHHEQVQHFIYKEN